ncbi:SRPBCC family protein [Streptomyces aureoverticillatus]|uniref:SRPBCC family protein n=1 Tax=Streptomyces aureoverticillatus TaxID=66871 RepID=UPI0013DA0853|nr:SRPBCC family protein [Streptomyces aureoverticillatus]QIB48128.1 SRPBCC family protein [Streptomyces aureoverticillatus]
MSCFETVTHINAPPQLAFDLSMDVDVHTASMADSAERVVAGVTAGRMELGDTVTWDARHFGLRWRMTSRISVLDRPGHFVDEQVSGPFKHWHHAHYFEPDGGEGTVMRDVIDYAAPLGLLGRVVESAVLDRYMRRLISTRNRHLKAAAEAAGV